LYLAYFVGHWPVSSGQPWFADIRQLPQAGVFAMHLAFAAALLAAAAVDADLFIIPLSIPILLVVLGISGAVLLDHPAMWALSPKFWWAARPIVGAVIGLAIANVLLWIKVLPRSFSADDVELQRLEAQAKSAKKKAGGKEQEKKNEEREEPLAPPPKLTRFGTSLAVVGVLIVVSVCLWITVSHKVASLVAVAAGIVIFLIGVLPRDPGQVDVTDEVMEEIASPFARREILKEAAFLLIPVAFAILAYAIPLDVPQSPRAARVLGALWGLLVGGGVVWAIRILGTLALNKEAMGLGDVHLMAGVGAVAGPMLAALAFFVGPFIAIPWIIVLKISGKPNALPYGPWLSVSSIICLLVGYPMLAWYFAIAFPNGVPWW
jgi:prepilin signal peptidase PulO-like enzyme (type II secretory pathway)